MPRKKNEILHHIDLSKYQHEQTRWSNDLINAPIVYSLVERRLMYFISREVKHHFVENHLDVPDNWKDLYFHLTDYDLGEIGGYKNVPHTYKILKSLASKLIPVAFRNEQGESIKGEIHWIDSFFYNENTGRYDVRISPEIMPYLIDISRNFTMLDMGTAMMLRSKYSQKMYELCCQFGGDFRYIGGTEKAEGDVYKKRVLPIKMELFRKIFYLDEVIDQRTKQVINKASYTNYRDIRLNILDVAQKELYELYANGFCNIWFDYQEGERKGRGGKVSSIVLYVYTREFPKRGEARPWKKGDEPLCPFEIYTEHKENTTIQMRVKQNPWYSTTPEAQEYALQILLGHHLKQDEVYYYMNKIRLEARRCPDSYIQVMQVIQEKERQLKFQNGTEAYKRNAIVNYALKENLKEFGWSLEPMQKEQKSAI